MGTVMRIVCFLLFCITRVSAVDTFPEKIALGRIAGNVTLRCDTAKQHVTWKHDSEDIEPSELAELKDKQLILHDFQEDQMGNYTCWSEGELVDYTYILLDESWKFTDSIISCTAETFNCTFKICCRMDQAGFSVFRLRNQRDDSSWVQRSEDGFFYLTHSTNPYAEEAERLAVIGEAVSSSDRYFNISHNFYLRDIIKPAIPQIKHMSKNKVTVRPPASWAKPESYYPLEHEIQYRKRDDGMVMSFKFDDNMKVPDGMSDLRVRSRDSLLLSQWSDWTPWQNVRKRRKKKQRQRMGQNKSDVFQQ
ncbi:interleukin-12 subunit beta [Colossoma macropomum]|uniref:interleukin-12 subunit beta n=1 Tax=Colossoma macropomum TaxID=42526 RepID=UPI0018649ECE|nr:interleukin-12 subunit beta [Colossoma macropomum]